MSTTTWHSRFDPDPTQYLLTNGEILKRPALEETASGRKVRIAGTNISMFSKDAEELITKGLELAAAERGARVWGAIDSKNEARDRVLGFDPDTTRARFFLNPEAAANNEATRAWWRFEHPTLPVHAYLVIESSRRSNGNHVRAKLSAKVVWQFMRPTTHENGTFHPYPMWDAATEPAFKAVYRKISYPGDHEWNEFVANHPNETIPEDLLCEFDNMDERVAIKRLLKKLREADAMDKLAIPDLRGMSNNESVEHVFDWLELNFVDSNYNSQIAAEIVDYLESGSAAEEIGDALVQLRSAFRRLGLVLEDTRVDHVLAAVQAGDDAALAVTLGGILDEAGNPCADGHSVSLHLPTGSLVVTCNKTLALDAAQKWDEGRILADITGTTEKFMGHAQEYFDGVHRRRTTKTIRVRRKQLEDADNDTDTDD